MNDDKKATVSPSRPMIGSAAVNPYAREIIQIRCPRCNKRQFVRREDKGTRLLELCPDCYKIELPNYK